VKYIATIGICGAQQRQSEEEGGEEIQSAYGPEVSIQMSGPEAQALARKRRNNMFLRRSQRRIDELVNTTFQIKPEKFPDPNFLAPFPSFSIPASEKHNQKVKCLPCNPVRHSHSTPYPRSPCRLPEGVVLRSLGQKRDFGPNTILPCVSSTPQIATPTIQLQA